MAENIEEEVQEEEAAPRKLGKLGKLLPILLAVLATGLGGIVGTTLLGPSVGSWMAASAAEGGGKKKSGGHGGGHGEAGAASYHILENLVVNPAGSDGLRYLLISVAIEPDDPEMVGELAAMDVAFRHVLLEFLGSKTVAELTDIGARDELVEEMKVLLEHELGEETIHRIYLPQYVIQ